MASDLLINYGDKEKSFPRIITVNQTLRPINKPKLADTHKSFINAISEPSGESPLIEKISAAKSVAIIIGDRRKIKQQITILEYVLDLLKNHPPEKIAIFLASASRGKLSLEDIKIPNEIISKYKFIPHDSNDESQSIYIGVTNSNTQVKINKELIGYDLKIGIDMIRPHLFAGFTGGGQIILPGLALKSTIDKNHSMRVKETCIAGSIEDNIVKKDMNEAAEFVDNLFVINSVLTRNDEFFGICAGSATHAFLRGVKIAKSLYKVPAKKTDVVIVSGGTQFTSNLYEAGKLLGAGGTVLNQDGIVILLAKCQNGTGNQEEFIQNIYQKSLINYLPYGHKIFLVSDLKKKDLENTIYTHFPSLEEAQNEALTLIGKHAKLSILHNTEYLIPDLSE